MEVKYLIYLLLAGVIRYLLIASKFSKILENRVEISTPLNSFKRVKEGIYLYQNGINPYSGDMVHESPIVLLSMASILNFCPDIFPFLYIIIDLLTGLFLCKMSKAFLQQMFINEKMNKKNYAKDTEDLQLQSEDIIKIPKYVLLAYIFNPYSVMNCVALTSTVFSNFFLSLYFYFLSKKQFTLCILFLAIESLRNLYPFVLIAPVILVFSGKSVVKGLLIVGSFIGMIAGICMLCFRYLGNWTFLDGTLGFIFFYRDLQPNIGLFWYFFTEMFEHFRTMFLITFQMNATILYLVPLTIKLRKDPLMLGTVLISLIAIFRSYPCLGDIGFYLAFLPIWKRSWKYMAHNFIVLCFFIITTLMMPTLWHLWIYAGSANANFYFGTTLAFCTGQIFLVTDLLFAYVKREFCLENGQKLYINGKEAKIILE